jgi:gliding motility-associated-like protein
MIVKVSIATFFLCCVCFFSKAQHTSPGGFFSINAIRGCAAPLNIIVSAPQCDAAGTIGCDVAYGNKNNRLTFKHGLENNTFSFTTAGTFYIYFQEGGKPLDSIRVEVFPNTPTNFDVFLCTGNQVTVKLNDVSYDEYVINYNDASPTVIASPGSTQNHPYTPGNHSVTVRGRKTNAADNCISQNKTVTVGAFAPPSIDEISVVNTDDIQFELSGTQSYYLTKLEVATNNGTSFQQMAQPVTTQSFLLNSLRPDLNYYCFQVAILNGCNNVVQARSNRLCTVKLDAAAENNQNRLTWATYTPIVTSYQLNRNSVSVPPPAAAALSHIDTDVNCNETYRYQLIAMSGASRSISNLDSATAFSTNTPPPVNNITAIVGETGVDLQWEPVTGFTPKTFQVFKTENGESFTLGTTTELQISDPDYVTESEVCYYLLYEDVCDNESPASDAACPIRLGYTLQQNNDAHLNWSEYTGWENDVAFYTLEKYDASGQLIGTISNITSPNYVDPEDTDHQVIQYVVKATANSAGLPQAVSNTIVIIKDPRIFHPTAFVPEGQPDNRIFKLGGRYIDSFEMQIYSRWGELLFITQNPDQGWDGTFKGNPMPEGTYTFVATITDFAGRTIKRSGNVILIRRNK